ncbi:ABC transporter permease [Clostridium tagluense]|uniref:ABC transporter permease n=1 Tax=Clostridium tagluense TaxID=360422 RepID=UPI001C0E3D6F|nr:ABC transporter permease [Clostridium tagluense]MBU3130016.1 ABC transporter permease [Clostridium tagluense]MCB2311869.1 ABC transporter permease [Clostridium tagluense]MCB2317376.1 ABC transporter permease [Clostridium tagluense]MCB2322830.1 ABC transporter permease [Clostridium tagluense]MCB2326930.1 ABC transporter permease [Clostridium tagluense]
MLNILWRNMKWRFQNPISIAVTILQPLIWLILYSAVAGQTMQNMGISNYTAFILPGIIVLVTFSACSSGGIINFIMKSSGSFYRILIAPVSRSSIVLGQMLEAILLSFIEIAILCIVGLFFSVKVESGIAGITLMILLIFMTAFFMSSIAYTISLLLPNEVIYETIINAIVLPIFFLSSALFPPEILSGGLAVAVMLNPFTHIINALRRLIFGETILLWDILPVITLFAVMCCGSFALAMWRLKKETAH